VGKDHDSGRHTPVPAPPARAGDQFLQGG
jgi:hypothetical protein